MRRPWMLVAAGLVALVVVVLIALNSGPMTSTQAIRAARTTPSTLEPPSVPFCRVVAALPPGGVGQVGSTQQLAVVAELQAVATPTVRWHLGVVHQYLTEGEPGADVRRWPSGVQQSVDAIEQFALEHC